MSNILDAFSLKGKIVLITGGAGLYGRQIVRGFAESGAEVYIASRKIEPLKQVADELCSEGYNVTAMSFDQGDTSSILSLRDEIISCSGRIDCLVNNAVYRSPGAMSVSREEWQKNMNINSAGLMEITRTFGDVMAKHNSGSIINVGSIYGLVGYDTWLYEDMSFDGIAPAYYFNKGGMANLTRFFGGYYGKYNIRVNCIHPGGFKSDRADEAFVEKYSNKTFLGRMAGDTDLVGCIVFLASDASSYITGANIPVDGGLTAK